MKKSNYKTNLMIYKINKDKIKISFNKMYKIKIIKFKTSNNKYNRVYNKIYHNKKFNNKFKISKYLLI